MIVLLFVVVTPGMLQRAADVTLTSSFWPMNSPDRVTFARFCVADVLTAEQHFEQVT
jgi:hypothetical protein